MIDAQAPGTVRQLSALMRMELLALRRDRTASAMAVVTPLAIGMVLAAGYDGGSVGGIERMASVLSLVVVLGVHHHLVTVYASRRQELVLKRLRAGLPSDATILVVMAAFSAALSAVTRSSEAAMLTSLPTSALFLVTPGALVPLGVLPEGVEAIARYLPLGPFTEVIREGWLGRDVLGMLPALGVLAVWLVLASLLARAVFRWEPRA